MVVFFQGCPLDCAGCFNPDTHSFKENTLYTAQEIFDKYYSADNANEGITVSGGEPFMQPRALTELLKTAKETYHLTTLVYTGFLYEDLIERDITKAALGFIDALVDGIYIEPEKEPTLLARGSTNQRIILLTDRYTEIDLTMPGKVEVIIGADGTVTETGFSDPGIKI